MNLRNIIVATICLAGMMTLPSCKEKIAKNEDPVLLLKEIERSDGTRFVFEYDSQDRITKYTEYGDNGQPDWVNTLTYNAQGDLIGYKDNEITVAYTKNGNKISFVDDEGGYTEIELDDQAFPVKTTYTWGTWYNATTTFTWQNGNLTKMEMVDEWNKYSEVTSFTYTYDDKKSPLYYCKTPVWFLSCEGYDITNNKKTWNEGTLDETYVYTYNKDGFPVTRKASDNNITDIYIYIKK